MKVVAAKQDKYIREIFIADVSLYSASMLVFVDETGMDTRDSLRKYGYSVRGRPAILPALICNGCND